MSDLPAGARAVVVTASNRAAAGVYEDHSGQALAEGLTALGFDVEGPRVLPDDLDQLEAVLRASVDAGADVVLTTGGTGLSPTDVTPEATRRVLEREAPGLAEAVRRYGREGRADVGALPRSGRDGRADADREPAWLHRWGPGRAGRARSAAAAHRQPAEGRRS